MSRQLAGVGATGSVGMVHKNKMSTANFDLDFMAEGSWLGINPKGQLYLREDDTQVYDHINAVIENCKQEWVLWGKDGCPGADELLVKASTKEEAEDLLNELFSEKPEYTAHYTAQDIKGRLIIIFKNIDNDMMLAFNASASSKYAFGNYFKKLVSGLLGAEKGTEPDQVITKIATQAMKKGKNAWNQLTFEFVKMLEDEIQPFNEEELDAEIVE